MSIFLVCGCVSCAFIIKDGEKVPCCVIHNCTTPSDIEPDLTERKARCSYGHKTIDSDPGLAFFIHRPDKEFDEYYCGCYGWS